VSPHPLVLDELKAALPKKGFQVEVFQIDERPSLEPERLKLPPVQVYALDGQGGGRVVERLANAVLLQQQHAAVLVLESQFGDEVAFPLLRAGAKGLLRYTEVKDQLGRAVQALAAGGYWVPRALLAKFVDALLKGGSSAGQARPEELSPRERQVMEALLENLANKEIAARLGISERTVKFHVSSILAKYKVQRRADLILRFYQEKQLGS
jgi:DNA-binding NarL/FixJ family response regulator